MANLQISWVSNRGSCDLESIEYAMKKTMFERECFEIREPAGIVQLLDGGNRVRFSKTNEFRLKIAKLKNDRKGLTGNRNLKEFFEVWLTDPTRRTHRSIDFCPKAMKSGRLYKKKAKRPRAQQLKRHRVYCLYEFSFLGSPSTRQLPGNVREISSDVSDGTPNKLQKWAAQHEWTMTYHYAWFENSRFIS